MANENELKNKTINGMFWSFLNKISNQGLTFIISVVLARLLSPDDFGVVALAGMFTVLLGIFSDGGLGLALVQKKDADELDFNTMFVTQLVFSSFMFVILYFLAPYFASFYDKPILTDIIRVSSLTMPLGALAGVQCSVVTRRLMFRWFFYSNVASTIISSALGLYMAYAGYGAWALVAKTMSGIIVSTIVIFFLLDWHPKFQFDYCRFKSLFNTGLKFMVSSLIGTVNDQLKGYLLGWKYSTADLAYFNRGEGLPQLVVNNIDSTIQGVLFPAIAQIQDDNEAVRRALRRAITTSTFALYPMLLGLGAICDKLVIIIFTEKWAPCIPFMRVLCVCYIVSVLCAVNLQALRATGHIGIIVKLEFIKKPLALIVLFITISISPLAIVYGFVFMNIFTFFVNAWPNKKYINYSYFDQIRDVAPTFLLALIMALIVYSVGLFIDNLYISVIVQVIIGAIFYLFVARILRFEAFFYVKDIIAQKFSKII